MIAHHLHNYWHPSAYKFMATALEGIRGPAPWAKLLNNLSRQHDVRKMQKRYIDLDEVNWLLQSYVACDVRDRFVPAVIDDVGIKLQ